MSQFAFLEPEFGDQFDLIAWSERHALAAPGPAILNARKALEVAVKWLYRVDRSLPQPLDDNLNAYLNTPTFKGLYGGRVFDKAKRIQRAGNRAAHEAREPTTLDAVDVLSAAHAFFIWEATVYGREHKPDLSVRFDPNLLPDPRERERTSRAERMALEATLDRVQEEKELARRRLDEARADREQLDAELAGLRAEVAAAKAQATATGPEIDFSEAETRAYKIDHLLREAGWRLTDTRDREFEVHGMPTADGANDGVGYVDYVLWGDDGLPLAVVEAKRAMTSIEVGRQQAKLYADCLENRFGQRPLMHVSNGYEHQLWDDVAPYPPRSVQGFHTKEELGVLIQRRETAKSLADLDIDTNIVERPYQVRAIRAIAESFEVDRQRKALLVMATGSGKTRTVIALVDLLLRANLVKRVLFLADRTALVNQAVGAFKAHLPDAAPVNLVTDPYEDGRVYVSTYQTMVGKIDEYRSDGTRRFGVGHFDLVVIDEAHRSVYRKYRGIFEYLDSLLVGLTATPRDEVDKNTYDLFDLETGHPTDVYELADAIDDGYLVPARGVSVPVKFVREGIRYDDLSEDEKDAWDEADWGEDDDGDPLAPPDAVSAEAVNKFLFNEDTVDKVLRHLMVEGEKVADGDRLGKTIIFAKSQRHAEYIYERFNHNYPALGATGFARVITHEVNYAQSLIDDFSQPDKPPHIAISVDMLDTGIDVPQVVNLVFFKLVRSKTKFWQMLGRGTRLCPDLYEPGHVHADGTVGRDKRFFKIFDFCQNLEYFSQPVVPADPAGAAPLSERLFTTRLELLRVLDERGDLPESRADIATLLAETVASMNPDNFLVRPHLEVVERFADRTRWNTLGVGDLADLANRVARLPDQLYPEHVDTKRFDLVVLGAQLGVLSGDPFDRQRATIAQIASALEDQSSIPAIAEQLPLIQDVQTDEWWTDVTQPMLEDLRRRIRGIVPLIERTKKNTIYTDIEDTIGDATEIHLPGMGGENASLTFAQFRTRAEAFLRDHLADTIVAKVRSGGPLTEADIAELQRVLVAAGIGDDATFAEASARAGDFGLFIRSLVGLDRAAAKEAFVTFLDDKRYTANQIRFVTMIIDELTTTGVVEPGRVYESPYDTLAPSGPEGLFGVEDIDRLFAALDQFRIGSREA